MAVTGFSLLLGTVSVLAGLAAVTLPLDAAEPAAASLPAARRVGLSQTRQPAEMPPPDFTAGQYIDSAGCVFRRVEGAWIARTDPQGAPLCGFPPTFSARRTGQNSEVALFPKPDEAQAERIRRELAEAIIPNLQAGKLLPSPPDGQARDDFPLGEMKARAPELARGMTRAGHTDRLCALIGSPAHDTGSAALGLCGTGTTVLAMRRTVPAREASEAASGQAATSPQRDTGRTARHEATASAATKARANPEAKAQPRDSRRMIPPDARYLQVGVFGDPKEAERTAGKLADLGLPVLRSRVAEGQQQLILVGPLDGREAIVRMIDRLARAGYRDLIARR